MIRSVLRAFGFLMLAAAFAALVVDGSRSIAGGRLLQYSLGDALAWFGGARYAAASAAASGWPAPAPALAAALVAVPAWTAAAALGLALLRAGRPASARPGLPGRRS